MYWPWYCDSCLTKVWVGKENTLTVKDNKLISNGIIGDVTEEMGVAQWGK